MYSQYSIDLGSFFLSDDITEALNRVASRKEGDQDSQEDYIEGGDVGN